MKQAVYPVIIIVVFGLFSCDRIINKGKKVTRKAQEVVENKSTDFADKIVPHFDAYNSDTKFNKVRFKDFLKVEITPDVKNIYCFADAIGIDSDYMFSSNCNKNTAEKIVEKHQLKIDKQTKDYGFALQHDFEWWDKRKIEKLDLYSWKGTQQYFKYFWYDETEGKAYFFDFDL
jgi:hypothetical protein